ncbi:hypothetical protein GCM10007285_38920 [Stappia taiwanensis]|nr:hypothetical protein GCM10007285_38920 [Stappia taiwanensis]
MPVLASITMICRVGEAGLTAEGRICGNSNLDPDRVSAPLKGVGAIDPPKGLERMRITGISTRDRRAFQATRLASRVVMQDRRRLPSRFHARLSAAYGTRLAG